MRRNYALASGVRLEKRPDIGVLPLREPRAVGRPHGERGATLSVHARALQLWSEKRDSNQKKDDCVFIDFTNSTSYLLAVPTMGAGLCANVVFSRTTPTSRYVVADPLFAHF